MALHWGLARKQVVDNRGQRQPKPNAIRKDMLPDRRQRRRHRRRQLLQWCLGRLESSGKENGTEGYSRR